MSERVLSSSLLPNEQNSFFLFLFSFSFFFFLFSFFFFLFFFFIFQFKFPEKKRKKERKCSKFSLIFKSVVLNSKRRVVCQPPYPLFIPLFKVGNHLIFLVVWVWLSALCFFSAVGLDNYVSIFVFLGVDNFRVVFLSHSLSREIGKKRKRKGSKKGLEEW